MIAEGQRVEIKRGFYRGSHGKVYANLGNVAIVELDSGTVVRLNPSSLKAL